MPTSQAHASPLKVLIVDDEPLARDRLRALLSDIAGQLPSEVVGEAGNGLAALDILREKPVDVVLADIRMPGMDGIEAARQVKQVLSETIIVMLTVRSDDELLFEALKNGAQGYLLKEIRSQELLEMLRGALRGEAAISPTLAGRVLSEFRRLSKGGIVDQEDDNGLTEREQQVLVQASNGATDKEIAAALNISLNTVKTHIRNILAKLHVSTRREAAKVARQKGLL
mgnify:CR=1 FL=1